MNKRKLLKVIAPSVMAMALSAGAIVGGTFALFEDENTMDIAVTAGKVDMSATVSDVKTFSGHDLTGDPVEDEANITQNAGLEFSEGGKVVIEGGLVTVSGMLPGDRVSFKINIANNSNVITKWQKTVKVLENTGLLSGLVIKINGEVYNGLMDQSNWETLLPGQTVDPLEVVIDLPSDRTLDYSDKSCEIRFGVEAVQGNAKTVDPEPGIIAIKDTVDFLTFADLAKTGAMDGKSVKLYGNINLGLKTYDPINVKHLTFDGNGYTISNFKVVGEKNVGLFGAFTQSTMKNLTISFGYARGINHVGVAAGDGLCSFFENINVNNSKAEAYTALNSEDEMDDGDKVGGIVGYVSGEWDAYVKNCTVKKSTVQGYRDVGGIVGYANRSQVVQAGRSATCIVTGNTVDQVKLVTDKSFNYKNYDDDAKYDVNEVIGEAAAGVDSSSNVATNITRAEIYSDGFMFDKATGEFQVYNGNGMKNFAAYVNGGQSLSGKTVKLTKDIDMSEVTDYVGVGKTNRFQGTFDGQDHTISNLTYSVKDTYGGAIFADVTGGAVIKNFTVDNVKVTSDLYNDAGRIKGNVYGIVCAYAYGDVTFDSITVKNSLVKAYGKVGAILGMAADPGTHTTVVKNCVIESTVTVDGVYNVAGLVGTLLNNGEFSGNTIDCVLKADIPAVDTNWTGTEELTVRGVTGTYCVKKEGAVIKSQNVQKAKVCVNYFNGDEETQIDVQGTVSK